MPKNVLSHQDRLKIADPAAVATAQELALLLRNDAVILFGSRARGNHRPDSDIDLLELGGTGKGDTTPPHFADAGNQAAAKVYGYDPHPEVHVLPMHSGTYQRTRRSRNFLAGHITVDAVVVAGDPQRWERDPDDLSMEPLHARRSALDALKATTILSEWKSQYPDEPDDLVLKAREAITKAHEAIASHAGLTMNRGEKVNALRARLKRRDWDLPEMKISLAEYDWYEKHELDSTPPMLDRPRMTAVVRKDVDQVLATAPTLHREARIRWERWKRARKNQSP